jgi:hypothetical protein
MAQALNGPSTDTGKPDDVGMAAARQLQNTD